MTSTSEPGKPPQTTEPANATPSPMAYGPFVPPQPPFRELQGYSVDPSLETRLDTRLVSHVTFHLPWELLEPGPKGEYLEVIDVDPPSRCCYEPVNLDHPCILAQGGLPPSERTPQFHQQMVYAVASLTIHNFEHALGRRTLWRHVPNPAKPNDDTNFCQRLRIYPHALREANAYYTPQRVALLFGYFNASADDPGNHMAGSMVFSCLSHDIVAHETTHALLDGMNRNFLNPSNPDVLAFHEAFADIVAVFQHFTFPEIVQHQIMATRGEIGTQDSLLSELAGQFGRSTGRRGALRKYIGQIPNPASYLDTTNPEFLEPHNRGALLVSAVFDAFLRIYNFRVADLLRLATGGSGLLDPGAIHPDLAQRLSDEAAKAARHVLTMCVRAIDYCPPVDITFGEFLRAVITADLDMVADDDMNYRTAFIQSFRQRGIYPRDVRTLSVESLRWFGPHTGECASRALNDRLREMRKAASNTIYAKSRQELFEMEIDMRRDLHKLLKDHFENAPEGKADAAYLGIDLSLPKFEVRTARFAFRTNPDGGIVPQLIIGLFQHRDEPVDPALPHGAQIQFEGGSTVIADLYNDSIKYCVRKSLTPARADRQRSFAASGAEGLRNTYFGHGFGAGAEPIAAVHRC
ncbi:MAG: hypothetical protein B7Z37_07220 [Verrucomicrobia bacterium 12-59-8]|nr:MAG: hypothetical protein B7Z37_07220 [Verrucomicrobia bacterium 12-59-8]